MAAETTFTPSETAVVSGVPLQAINKAIDEGPLDTARSGKSRRRILTEADLLYLATASVFDPKLVQLTDRAKERLRRAVAAHCRLEKSLGKLKVFDELEVDIRPIFSRVRSRAALQDRAKKMVTRSPHIRGREPVIRGTRSASTKSQPWSPKVSEQELEEILDGYPGLKREQIVLARIYAAAHPRRGRPRKHPWHDLGSSDAA